MWLRVCIKSHRLECNHNDTLPVDVYLLMPLTHCYSSQPILYTTLCESSRKADQHRNRRHVRTFPASSPCRIAVPVLTPTVSLYPGLMSIPGTRLLPQLGSDTGARVKPHSIAMALPLCTAVATAPRR